MLTADKEVGRSGDNRSEARKTENSQREANNLIADGEDKERKALRPGQCGRVNR